MKHTPGPWYAVNYAGYWNLQAKDYYEEKADLLNEEHTPDAEANAQLAAAAPELAEALKEILPFAMEWINENHPALKRAKGALKKAGQ